MKIKLKGLSLLTILLLVIFLISSCSPSDRDLTRSYDLQLEVSRSDDGAIRDVDRNRLITTSSRTLNLSRNSRITIEAQAVNDFLFWSGDYNNAFNEKQNILMDNNKNLIAVVGEYNNIFMAGDITKAWHHNNVVGYWIAHFQNDQFEEGTLELYLRETSGSQRKNRYIFDKELFDSEISSGEIFYYDPKVDGNPDLPNYEYIAAIMRIEEGNYLDFDKNRILFVYSDLNGIEISILPETNSNLNKYKDIIAEGNIEEFKNKIKRVIYDNRNNDYLLGNTFIINHPDGL